MAMLVQKVTVPRAFNTGSPAPKGTWHAVCADNIDQLGVVRPVFKDPGRTETVDLTTFLFEFTDTTGNKHQIASKAMRISANEKSSLSIFLKSWMGQHSLPPNFNTQSMIGQRAFITIDHKPSNVNPGVMFANLTNISPVPQGYVQRVNGGTPNVPTGEASAQQTVGLQPQVGDQTQVIDDEAIPLETPGMGA